jgi:hypothetical protein
VLFLLRLVTLRFELLVVCHDYAAVSFQILT